MDVGSDDVSPLADEDDRDRSFARKKRQSLDDDAPPADAPPADGAPGLEIPDPEETKRKAQEAMDSAGEAASKAAADAEKALLAILPIGDVFKALGWHLDFCCYLATMYAVYYVWKSDLHWRLLPKLEWAQDNETKSAKEIALEKKVTQQASLLRCVYV